MIRLTSPANAHNAAEASLNSFTVETGASFHTETPNPSAKFDNTNAKKTRSRQQRVSLINPAISRIQTADVTMNQTSCDQSNCCCLTWEYDT